MTRDWPAWSRTTRRCPDHYVAGCTICLEPPDIDEFGTHPAINAAESARSEDRYLNTLYDEQTGTGE